MRQGAAAGISRAVCSGAQACSGFFPILSSGRGFSSGSAGKGCAAFGGTDAGTATGGAAGAAEALACIFAITHGVVPPTINCENLDPEIDPNLNLTLNKAQKREVRCALSNTFGFGGHNSTVIFRKI